MCYYKTMRLEFPKNFYWGAATSSHQVEGNNRNDWSEWEKSGDRIKDLEKRGLIKKYGLENYISGYACDHYNRFHEDFDIAKSLGHNAHRFSIEWSRIEPEEGKFDEKEIEHYRQVILALKERGIEPFVTLWHWTVPVWFAQKGGWLNKDAPRYFERYTNKISRSLQNVRFWITLNEPTVYVSHAFMRGIWPPQGKSFIKGFKAVDILAEAHRLAYARLHAVNPDCSVSVAKNDVYYKSNFLAHYFDDSYFLKHVKDSLDFTAINYYFHFRLFKNKILPLSDMGWDIYPEGIYHILKRAKKYNKPIYIMENGLADAKDGKREKFIKEHLYWIHKSIEEGADVRGYLYWSLLDNFEWDKGFWPRFGLVEVDYKTLKRKIRPSAYEYAKICKDNVLEI